MKEGKWENCPLSQENKDEPPCVKYCNYEAQENCMYEDSECPYITEEGD